MVRIGMVLVILLAGVMASEAAAKVRKVLPHYLDLKGRHTLAPSLYERDAYQAKLRRSPELRSAIRFDIRWKSATTKPVRLKLEARGRTGDETVIVVLSDDVRSPTGRTRWSSLTIGGKEYEKFGELHAWRVTLWDGDKQLAEGKSFLW